jgi:hypothetical protein
MLCSAPSGSCDQFALSGGVIEEIYGLAILKVGAWSKEPGDDPLGRPGVLKKGGDTCHDLEPTRRSRFLGCPPLNLAL